ncbi:MAG: hypothetical protein O2815_08425 [Actinomycetota bacterium]|nr:hypothetical protein [Actinomycetota bacterium]
MDILGRHNAPSPIERVEIDTGFAAFKRRRPRSRRPTAVRAAYDARQLFLEAEASGPPQSWSLGPILYGITRQASTAGIFGPETADRLSSVDLYFELAAARGLSPAEHLLPYLRELVPRSIFALVVAGSTEGAGVARHIREWVELCAVPDSVDGRLDRVAASRAFALIRAWAEEADQSDLLSWTAPDSLPQAPLTEGAGRSEGATVAAWIFERFTETYIDRWSSDTLRLEWRYLHGQQGAPCSSVEMRGREVPVEEVAAVMAERFARPRGTGRGATSGDFASNFPERTTSFLVEPALKFIQDGRRAEARALFEAVLIQDRDSASANNNLGFCLIPDNPQQALEYLDRAKDLGATPNDLTDANRLMALALLGRSTMCLDLALSTFGVSRAAGDDEKPSLPLSAGGSFLWEPESLVQGTHAKIVQITDLRSYAELVVHLVCRGGS